MINRSKGSKHLFDPSVESGDAPLQLLDETEVMVDKESMMRCHATVERCGKVRPGTLQTGRSEFGQPHRVRLARDHRFQNAPPAHAHDVRNNRDEFDVGVLQCLLNTLNVLRKLADQLCSCTSQVSQLLDRGWRHKARPDQAMRQKVGDPHCVVDVTLAAGNIADMSSIREHKLEPTLQQVPDRLPVDARSLHRYVRDSLACQPIRKLQKVGRRR